MPFLMLGEPTFALYGEGIGAAPVISAIGAAARATESWGAVA
jgi:hypothetical protein